MKITTGPFHYLSHCAKFLKGHFLTAFMLTLKKLFFSMREFGFKNKYSTVDALVVSTGRPTLRYQTNNSTVYTFLDLKKAFETAS